MALEKILKNSSGVPTGEYERIAGGTLYADSPIGTILAFGGADAPAGWMICDGTSLLRASYPELFAVIGTAFGSADSTHFNIPDMRESVPVGSGTSDRSGITAHDSYTVGQFKDDQIQNFSLRTAEYGGSTSWVDGYGVRGNGNDVQFRPLYQNEQTYLSGDARVGTTTHGKQLGVNYIIKAKMIGVPADFAPVNVVENGNTKAVTSNAVYDYIGSLSGVTQVGDWKLIRLGSSNLYLGFYYRTNISPDTTRYYVPLPNGYSSVQYYFGQCFQEGYTQNVTGATHTGGTNYAMTIYFTGGATGNVYEVRACCLFQKNS